MIVSLLVVSLLAGCGDSTTSPAPSATAPAGESVQPPTPAPTLTATGPSATPTATASPVPGGQDGLAPGSVAVTVADRLRVRSQPRVSDDSVKYEPLLPAGTQLLVIEGPVAASGYDWYHVAPVSLTLSGGVADGWVAAADHDGTPWIAHAADPLDGLEVAQATVERSDGTASDADRAASSINAFALDLYRQLRSDPSVTPAHSLVFSPTSIALALTMARAGARGTTATEMDGVLHTTGWPALSSAINALDQDLAGHDAAWTDDAGQSHALSLRIANTAFGQRGYAIEPAFLDAIAQALGAGLGLVDYAADPEQARNVINEWVSRQTAGRIPELLTPSDISSLTRLVLVNAIYMKANWEVEFEPAATRDRSFTLPGASTIKAPTMHLDGGQVVPYASGSGWQATELRYLGADGSTPLAMDLILPDTFSSFEKGLTVDRLDGITSALSRQRKKLAEVTYAAPAGTELDCGTYAYSVNLFLPRFGIDTRTDLVGTLAAMGMHDAVDPLAADFSGITTADRLAIAHVIHDANIDVDEQGTEAAAATAIVGDTTGGCGGPQAAKTITLRFNRPFLFLIRDLGTGAILFMGRVVDPSTR